MDRTLQELALVLAAGLSANGVSGYLLIGLHESGGLAVISNWLARLRNLVARRGSAPWPTDLRSSDEVLTELASRGYTVTADLLGCPTCLGFHLAWVVTGVGSLFFGFDLRDWALCFGVCLLVQRITFSKR